LKSQRLISAMSSLQHTDYVERPGADISHFVDDFHVRDLEVWPFIELKIDTPVISSRASYTPILVFDDFLRATAVPAGTAEARISYGNSVCLSVRPSVRLSQPGGDRDSGSSPYGSLEYLVSYEVICCQWVRRFPSNKGIKEGYPP